MKKIWNQGPERVTKANKILIDVPSFVKPLPPYDTAVVVQGHI